MVEDKDGAALDHLSFRVLEGLGRLFGIHEESLGVRARIERVLEEIGIALWLVCDSRQELELLDEARR